MIDDQNEILIRHTLLKMTLSRATMKVLLWREVDGKETAALTAAAIGETS